MGKVVLARGNNPISYVDPDGREVIKPTARIGQQAHTYFEDYLSSILVGDQNAKGREAYSDRSLKVILNKIISLVFDVETKDTQTLMTQDPAIDELSNPSKRPDLTVVDKTTKSISVYELKPASCMTGEKNIKAKNQLNSYVSELSKTSSGYTVSGGFDIPSSLVLPYPEKGANATITFTADPITTGLYYYIIDDGNGVNYE